MIPIADLAFYEACLRSLSGFVGNRYSGRRVQIFLAAKYLGEALPRVGANRPIEGYVVERLLDAVFVKRRDVVDDRSVKMIFANNHLQPSGFQVAGRSSGENIWRNNLGMQKAIACHASEEELTDPAFLAEDRLRCRHIRLAVAGSLEDARCSLNMTPKYRGENGPKSLRRDPLDETLAIVDPADMDHWRQSVLSNGRRLPIVPLICALYFGSDCAGERQHVGPLDFMRDFNFSRLEYLTYFDDDPLHAVHQQLVDLQPGLTWTRVPADGGPIPEPENVVPNVRRQARRRLVLDLDNLPPVAPRIAPPAGGHWWSAEQAVEAYLRDSGWNVINRTQQSVGFDIEAWRPGRTHRYVEVKSSVGRCNPVLTRNEYETACRHGNRYTLAIVENYHPDQPYGIWWVHNPALLNLNARVVEEYPLPWSVWSARAVAELEE